MLFLLGLTLLMIILSTIIGARKCSIYQIRYTVNFSQRGIFNYTLGLHHVANIGVDRRTGSKYRVETLSIGLLLFTLELNFYKELSAREEDFVNGQHPDHP